MSNVYISHVLFPIIINFKIAVKYFKTFIQVRIKKINYIFKDVFKFCVKCIIVSSKQF